MLSGGDRALGDRSAAVHDTGTILVEAMPVDTSGLVTESIVNVDNDSVSNFHINLGAGPLIVDTDHRSLESVGGGIDPGDVPVKIDVLGRYQLGGQASQEYKIKLAH